MEMKETSKSAKDETQLKIILQRMNINFSLFKDELSKGKIDLVNGKVFYASSQ